MLLYYLKCQVCRQAQEPHIEFELRILAWYEGVIGFLERREDHNHIIEGD